MLKSQTKVHKSCSKSIFDILADNLINLNVLNSYKKTKKNSKKRLLGPMSRSKLYENGPKIVEKKYTVAHSIPDVTPRKNKKLRSVWGTICWDFRYLKIQWQYCVCSQYCYWTQSRITGVIVFVHSGPNV
jgi:hypothetical protein